MSDGISAAQYFPKSCVEILPVQGGAVRADHRGQVFGYLYPTSYGGPAQKHNRFAGANLREIADEQCNEILYLSACPYQSTDREEGRFVELTWLQSSRFRSLYLGHG